MDEERRRDALSSCFSYSVCVRFERRRNSVRERERERERGRNAACFNFFMSQICVDVQLTIDMINTWRTQDVLERRGRAQQGREEEQKRASEKNESEKVEVIVIVFCY